MFKEAELLILGWIDGIIKIIINDAINAFEMGFNNITRSLPSLNITTKSLQKNV